MQLNVNNPHFLIMQGRITKVLNMKPPEILGLLEEAAGTKMYESKKQAALRTMDKKQVKVDEINKVLSEDIMPALDKLRREKVQYMEWQNATASLDRLRRFCVAYKFVEAEGLQRGGEDDLRAAEGRLAELEAAAAALGLEIREKEDEVAGLQVRAGARAPAGLAASIAAPSRGLLGPDHPDLRVLAVCRLRRSSRTAAR